MATAKKQSKKAAKTGKNGLPAQAGSFAVIATGGKQYLVCEGDVVTIEKLKGEHQKGDKVSFDQVLLTDKAIGTPVVAGAVVECEIAAIGRAPKVTVIKYKQKSRYFKKNGHRQPFLKVKVTAIK